MKRITPLIILVMLLLCSCTHKKHSYKSSWSYDEEKHWRSCDSIDCNDITALAKHSFTSYNEMLICSVCGFKKQSDKSPTTHTHLLSDSYTASSTHHWQTCSVCDETVTEPHVFDEEEVVTPPSSDSEGIAERCCTICNRIVSVTLPMLPEKMSEEEWKACFVLKNVKIDERSKSGSLLSEETTYCVDGNLVAIISDEGTIYYNRDMLSSIDFSQHYDKFSHYGDGVYKSSGFEINKNGSKLKANDVSVKIHGSTLQSVSYTIKLGGFGTMTYIYTFHDWGEIKLSPSYFDTQTLNALLNEANFSSGLSLTYQKYDYNGNYTESQLTVNESTYVCKNYQNGSFKGISNGCSADATAALVSHLYSILSSFESHDLVYEEFYESFTYVGQGVNIAGIGYVTSCDVAVTDGRINMLNIQLANGTTYYYDIYYA